MTLRALCAAVLAGVSVGCGALAAVRPVVGDQVDVTAAAIAGRSQEECTTRLFALAAQAHVLSAATSPPFGLSDGLRAFYDHVLRLDARGELSSLGQISASYVAGHDGAGAPIRASVVTFVRVEVARPDGTPPEAPSRFALAWMWLDGMAEAPSGVPGRTVQQPRLHRFDIVGDLVTTQGTWGVGTAACQPGAGGEWFGAVAVWTYLPP